MPDTGPPWNIPYVEPTDNPRVYPAASEDLAEAIADGLDAAGNAGIGSNVVVGANLANFTTTSTSFVAVTNVAATITPSSSDAKVFVMFSAFAYGEVGGGTSIWQIKRATTVVYGPVTGSLDAFFPLGALFFVDSPATGSPVTYTVEVRQTGGGTSRVQHGQIVVIEVAE
jgi:hypothetical protein